MLLQPESDLVGFIHYNYGYQAATEILNVKIREKDVEEKTFIF